MTLPIAIAMSASLGALCRYAISFLFHASIALFVVNALGSFAAGMILGTTENILKNNWNPLIIQSIQIGFLGSFTTFSAFSTQSLIFLREDIIKFALYVLFQNGLCIFCAAMGLWVITFVLR